MGAPLALVEAVSGLSADSVGREGVVMADFTHWLSFGRDTTAYLPKGWAISYAYV